MFAATTIADVLTPALSGEDAGEGVDDGTYLPAVA